jgi:hypothetical protein
MQGRTMQIPRQGSTTARGRARPAAARPGLVGDTLSTKRSSARYRPLPPHITPVLAICPTNRLCAAVGTLRIQKIATLAPPPSRNTPPSVNRGRQVVVRSFCIAGPPAELGCLCLGACVPRRRRTQYPMAYMTADMSTLLQ